MMMPSPFDGLRWFSCASAAQKDTNFMQRQQRPSRLYSDSLWGPLGGANEAYSRLRHEAKTATTTATTQEVSKLVRGTIKPKTFTEELQQEVDEWLKKGR